MMIRRVGKESFELFPVLHRSELGGVESAVGIEFDAQHIVDTDKRNDRAEKIGALGEHGAHQQAAVASSHDCQVRR